MLETPAPFGNTKVKQHWVWIVLGWETAWELRELLAWVQTLKLLGGECTVRVWPTPLVAVEPRCLTQVVSPKSTLSTSEEQKRLDVLLSQW